jgi:uncharacterized repeat protein (TIGR01451 family)
MKRIYRIFLSLVLLSLFIHLNLSYQTSAYVGKSISAEIQTPSLKWQHGGCYSSWCETGWYSSPAVADLNGDGINEVIASAYSIFVLNGETGNLEWQVASGHDRSEPDANVVGRTWPGIVISDVDADGIDEIVTAHSGGYVSVYTSDGYFKPGWPQRPTERELRGLSVYDLDNDGTMEIIVTGAVYNKVNTWVYEHDGGLRPGWPQLVNDSGYAYGIFNDNSAVGDLDGDGYGELIIPSDVHYICAYTGSGVQLPAHSMYGDNGWGKVGVWESLEVELRGWGYCDGVRAESYRTNFAHGASVIADVNGDGSNEVVVTGNVYDCSHSPYLSRYNGIHIFNSDRSRFKSPNYDWDAFPVDTGAPLSENYGEIENNQPNPIVADLDGDGELEILYSSYDGRVHAFWLDKTEHGNWPYSVYNSSEGFYRFASEPVVVDLDNDGTAEVIFASWVEKSTNHTGKLHILDYLGTVLHEINLPYAYGSPNWNGVLPAPTLDNIDSDDELEVVLNSAHSGVIAYDLPGSENARLIWGTGRGNYLRNGYIASTLENSVKTVDNFTPDPGDRVTYTIMLQNPGSPLMNVVMTDTLPGYLSFGGYLWASTGVVSENNDIIAWTGDVTTGSKVEIKFDALISDQIIGGIAVENTAIIRDNLNREWQRKTIFIVNGFSQYLPLVGK